MTACAGVATATFDPFFSADPDEQEWAKARCRRCPITAACLAGAVERDEPAGIWGGRAFGAPVLEAPPAFVRQRIVAPHGHRKAYIRGCRCGPCTQSNAAYVADWRLHRRWIAPVTPEPTLYVQLPIEGITA